MDIHTDFAVIGGSYAGMSAALQLARARRQGVCVDPAGAAPGGAGVRAQDLPVSPHAYQRILRALR